MHRLGGRFAGGGFGGQACDLGVQVEVIVRGKRLGGLGRAGWCGLGACMMMMM